MVGHDSKTGQVAKPKYQGRGDESKDLGLGDVKCEAPVRHVSGAVQRRVGVRVWGSGQRLGPGM